MLPDRALQLLTAYVDGELSQRQRKLVVRLLHKSIEARQILKDLQEQAQLLRSLPARTLDSGFADEVVAAVQRSTNTKRPTVRRATRRPAWVFRVGVAAAVLIAASLGIAWFASRPNGAKTMPLIAEKKPEVQPAAPRVDHGPLIAQFVEGVAREFNQPPPPDRPGAKFSFDELAKTQWQEHLVEGMIQQKSVHIDVAVVNDRQAVQRLETVLQNKGIKVVIDPPAQAKLGKNLARTEYVIYAENIRPDELAAMLYELGTDERARTSIETLTVSNVTDTDQKQLCGLLGIESRELQEPPVNKPIPFNQFVPKGDKKSDGPEPASPKDALPNDVTAPRVAMVMVNEARGGALSSQIQYFLSQRRQRQPQALQVIVVVRQA